MSREAFAAQTNVSRETLERLDTYAERLIKWNRAINLVAKPTLDSLWTRHFLDSAQVLDHAPATAKTWIDLGSGAGFPGLVVAVLRLDIAVTLVESDRRKSVFLSETARACGLTVTVLTERAENIEQKADIVSARALAPLADLLALSQPLLTPGGTALFLKGENVENELTEANRVWHIKHTKHDSLVDPRGSVLSITDFHRRTDL